MQSTVISVKVTKKHKKKDKRVARSKHYYNKNKIIKRYQKVPADTKKNKMKQK